MARDSVQQKGLVIGMRERTAVNCHRTLKGFCSERTKRGRINGSPSHKLTIAVCNFSPLPPQMCLLARRVR